MKRYLRNSIQILLVVIIAIIFNDKPVQVEASMVEQAERYELGTEFKGHVDNWEDRYFKFYINKKSYVTLKGSTYTSNFRWSIYNARGKEVFKSGDFIYKTNSVNEKTTGSMSRILSKGTYYLEFTGYGTDFSFSIQAEKQITFPKGSISSVKSTKKGEMTVTCKAASNAIGYRIIYSTDERFKGGVKTVYSPTRKVTIKNLKKGKRYYVKVCPYTVYDDGSRVFGQNSYVKTIVVRK